MWAKRLLIAVFAGCSLASKGECDLELDDGRTVPMKAGDICVQRGTMHAWVAKGSEPAVFA
ncbi:MAG: hypothetical protein WA709_27445, partial [Stellaceae bacterium]